ncbi:class I SAM-dependent methyltransferase [Gilvimarinus algae]|uniref:Class I SAM-dependent methyltransferase n=1 Tax=Gilvimarinus algae TaxID=3058037 RepID=A0ABT8TAY6_9GAMM|nr:class I SAM-dependent methyltransferase [Gilvimarinus sp. SDUM040014]MDO3381075.1 class I SAM-dependent methyltransferase [Gilvimarinus sp. SDUM040014]
MDFSKPATWISNQYSHPSEEIDAQFTYNSLELPIPSKRLRATVSGPELDRFLYIGSAWTQLSMQYTTNCTNPRVLDIGCGVGKMARHFCLLPQLEYIGFDIYWPAIEWCQYHFKKVYGNRFNFHHFDGISHMYNPKGRVPTRDFIFPCQNGSIDLAIGASILTHLYEGDISHYLKQTAASLSPNGVAIFSTHTPDEFCTFFPETPIPNNKDIVGNEQVMMISDDFLDTLALEAGLHLKDRPGRLCGQQISVFERSIK